jgi:hypothetical protein
MPHQIMTRPGYPVEGQMAMRQAQFPTGKAARKECEQGRASLLAENETMPQTGSFLCH